MPGNEMAMVQVETRPGAAWYTGETGQGVVPAHPPRARSLDEPREGPNYAADGELVIWEQER